MSESILVLGNGLSVGPLVAFFLRRGRRVSVACRRPERMHRLGVDPRHLAAVLPLDLDSGALDEQIAGHDLVASFVPGPYQPQVAAACVEARRPLVVSCHAHYFEGSPGGAEALDARARRAGIPILTELGVDCGYLGMLCKRQVDRLQAEGWQITSLDFHTGVLPGQDVNPLDYAFFWAARKAALSYLRPKAGKADWIRGGARVRVDRDTVYRRPELVSLPSGEALETHPNLDSGAWPYRDVYGLEGIERFFHGTLRHIGWCGTLQALLDLGYGGEAPRPELLGRPLSEVTLTLLGRRSGDARQAAAEALSRDPHDDALLRLDWLGLFSDRPARSSGGAATADIAAELMLERLGVFGPDSGVSSRVVNVFDLEARARGRVRRLRSTFDAHDEGVGHSTCSRLISETTALAGEALLCGPLRGLTGLHHPYQAEVYAPVLAGFEAMGFAPQLEERDGS